MEQPQSQAELMARQTFRVVNNKFVKGRSKQLDELGESLDCLVEVFLTASQDNFDGLFQILCEQEFPSMIYFLARNYSQLQYQMLSLVSMIIINIGKNHEALVYFLSHPDLHHFIRFEFNLDDEEVAIVYSRLLVSLTNLICAGDKWRIFASRKEECPLLLCALRLYNHPDSTIRTGGRSVLLSLLQLNQPNTNAYYTSFPFMLSYPFLAAHLHHECQLVARGILSADRESLELAKGLLDSLTFICDLHGALEPRGQVMLANSLAWAFRIPASYYEVRALLLLPGKVKTLAASLLFSSKINPAIPQLLKQSDHSLKSFEPNSAKKLEQLWTFTPGLLNKLLLWERHFDHELHLIQAILGIRVTEPRQYVITADLCALLTDLQKPVPNTFKEQISIQDVRQLQLYFQDMLHCIAEGDGLEIELADVLYLHRELQSEELSVLIFQILMHPKARYSRQKARRQLEQYSNIVLERLVQRIDSLPDQDFNRSLTRALKEVDWDKPQPMQSFEQLAERPLPKPYSGLHNNVCQTVMARRLLSSLGKERRESGYQSTKAVERTDRHFRGLYGKEGKESECVVNLVGHLVRLTANSNTKTFNCVDLTVEADEGSIFIARKEEKIIFLRMEEAGQFGRVFARQKENSHAIEVELRRVLEIY